MLILCLRVTTVGTLIANQRSWAAPRVRCCAAEQRNRQTMRILVASSSTHRQAFYRKVIEGLGDEVRVAASGIECAESLRIKRPDLLVLETPLLWGGSDGVLALLQEQAGETPLPVIPVAAALQADDFFRLGRFRLDNFLFHVPTAGELQRAIASFGSRPPETARGEPVVQPSG